MADSIIRCSEHLKNFTLIDNTCLQTETLSMQAMGLFAYLMMLPSDWTIYKSELVKHFSNGRDAVYKAFNELIDAGFITYVQNTDEAGRFTGNTYYIHEQPVAEKDRTKRPVRSKVNNKSDTNSENCNSVYGKPQPEKPYTENPSLLSTNNTKDLLPSTKSKSHCETSQPKKQEEPSESSHSNSSGNKKRNSKSHCGKATESDEFKKQVQEIKLLYIKNYQSLFEKHRVNTDKPTVIWSRAINKIKESVKNFGFDAVKNVLTTSLNDDWLIKTGYVLTTILSDSIFSRLSQSICQSGNHFYEKTDLNYSHQKPAFAFENINAMGCI